MADRRYSKEEVDAILGRAIDRERSVDGLSHEELLSVAREVGVSPESLEKAASEIVLEQREKTELADLRSDAWRGFVGHLIPYVFVNSLLVLLNFATTHFPWALFPILGWGIGLFSHLMAVAFPSRERLERRLERQRLRQRRKQLKREVKASAKHFETAVGEGVATLLQVAAVKIGEKIGEKVGESMSGENRARAPRVRVHPGEEREPRSPYGNQSDEYQAPNPQERRRR